MKMFKYVWIMILALAALFFIVYSLRCIFDTDEHPVVTAIWLVILFIGIASLFAASLVAWSFRDMLY